MAELISSFPPVIGSDPRVLILGSMQEWNLSGSRCIMLIPVFFLANHCRSYREELTGRV